MNNTELNLPAEWHEQEAILLAFPTKETDWNNILDDVIPVFIEIIHHISNYQKVLLIANNKVKKQYFSQSKNITFLDIPINDTWARDFGFITTRQGEKWYANDFLFNGWGEKFEAEKDNKINFELFTQKAIKKLPLRYISHHFILEGGAIESNGKGVLLTTSQCLLSPKRNKGLSKKDIEKKLMATLGVQKILWLDHGNLVGDDTDAHIDTLVRFVDEKTLFYTYTEDKKDIHYESLQKLKHQLQSFTDLDNTPFNLVKIPLPTPCLSTEDNRQLPATYANFLFINNAILLPIYDVPTDQKAIEIFTNFFTEKKIIPINCRKIIEQHGSLHCLTMQIPRTK